MVNRVLCTLKVVLIVLFSIALFGCSTIDSKKERMWRPFYPSPSDWGVPYSGVRDLYHDYIECNWGNSLKPILFPFAIIDLPLSLIADTLVLPYDLIVTANPDVKEFSARKCSRVHM